MLYILFLLSCLFGLGESGRCRRVVSCTNYDVTSCLCRQCVSGTYLVYTSPPKCLPCQRCAPGHERINCAFSYQGDCERAPCPEHSHWNGSRCNCQRGFGGRIFAFDTKPFFRGTCQAVSRPPPKRPIIPALVPQGFFIKPHVMSGCNNISQCLDYDLTCGCQNCSFGYYLNVTPGFNTTCSACPSCPPWQYRANCTSNGNSSGTCLNVTCPALSSWNGSWCLCDSGYRGNLRSIPQPPFVKGSCTDKNE